MEFNTGAVAAEVRTAAAGADAGDYKGENMEDASIIDIAFDEDRRLGKTKGTVQNKSILHGPHPISL